MKQYFVIAKVTCELCGGKGLIAPHADFWDGLAKLLNEIGTLPPDEQIIQRNKYCYDRGYSPHSLPLAKEIECPDCEGVGTVKIEVPLNEALDDISRTEIPESMRV